MFIKYLILCIVLIQISIIVVKSDYVKFTPYLSNDCKGDESGIGYNLLNVNTTTCFTRDFKTSFKISVKSNGDILIEQFKQLLCQVEDGIIKSIPVGQNTCIESISFNTNLESTIPYYHLISIQKTVQPMIAKNSIVNSFSIGKTCSTTPPLMIEYFTNNTIIKSNNDNKLQNVVCGNGVVNSCKSTLPFFNVTSNKEADLTYTSGFYTGNTVGNQPNKEADLTYSSGFYTGNTVGVTPDNQQSKEADLTYTSGFYTGNTVGDKIKQNIEEVGGNGESTNDNYFISNYCSL